MKNPAEIYTLKVKKTVQAMGSTSHFTTDLEDSVLHGAHYLS